jgi:hypothetical protein
MHHVVRNGGRAPSPAITKSSRHSCSVRRLEARPSNDRERCESSWENWKAFRSIAFEYT